VCFAFPKKFPYFALNPYAYQRATMTIRFSLDRWAAWAPGLPDAEAWQAWLAAPRPLPDEGLPALAEMPAMMRRRLERLGRIALQAAYWGQDDAAPCPIVFASRHGDSVRTVALLRQLAAEDGLSPTAFSLSVHNAIGALFSIARQDPTSYTAVALGEETAEAAFTEALGLLADGEPCVLVVCYDEPLPEPFDGFNRSDEFPRAWACRLSRAQAGGLSLETLPAQAEARATDLPPDLTVLRFLLSTETTLEHTVGARTWRWQRHA